MATPSNDPARTQVRPSQAAPFDLIDRDLEALGLRGLNAAHAYLASSPAPGAEALRRRVRDRQTDVKLRLLSGAGYRV